jgi:ankyrin repeat protein
MIHGTDDGNTLLHFASRVGNILLIRKLLQQGEDINVKNRSGQTALDIAKQYQQKEVVLELSRHGRRDKIKRREEQLPHRVCCCLIDAAA